MTPYESFTLYFGYRQHLTTKYDFRKYRGKIFVKPHQFDKRNDKYAFHQIATLYKRDTARFYQSALTAPFGHKWAGDLTNEQFGARFNTFERYDGAPLKYFRDDVRLLLDYCHDYDLEFPSLFSGKELPVVWSMYLDNHIHFSTIDVLNRLTKFADRFKIQSKSWSAITLMLNKYQTLHLMPDLTTFGRHLRVGIETGELP